jgi:signal transduction histidine kinase
MSRGVPIRDDHDRVDRWIGVLTDIHDRKRAEEQLRLLNEELERRVVERTTIAERRAQQLREMTLELTQAEQRERRRLAQVLHDHLQQLLVAAKMQLGGLLTRVGGEDQATVRGLVDLMNEAVASSRSLTVELSPPVLYEGGLVPALRWLGRRMHEQHNLEVEIDAEQDIETETEDLRVVLFLSVRELLFNVAKHAQTPRAVVRLGRENGRITAEVEDGGPGFDPEAAERATAGGFGLFSIRERLRALGGDLAIDSAPGRGARMKLMLPAPPA